MGSPRIYTTELEPFQRSRERRLRLTQAGKAKGDVVSRRLGSGGSNDRKKGIAGHQLWPTALRRTQAIVPPDDASITDSSKEDTAEPRRVFVVALTRTGFAAMIELLRRSTR